MLRRATAWGAATLAGVLLGAVSAWATLGLGQSRFVEHYGAWSHNRAAGSQAAGPYSRAIIAREGLLALSAREALYFSLSEDEQGRRLDESCIYQLDGRAPAARWWSVTLYADDDFLAQNGDHAHSLDASRTNVAADGRWRARISPVRGDAPDWLSSRAARRGFSLMLRVYNPRREFRPSADTLPTLSTISCAPP